MKIIKWITSAVLLTVLAVSVANAKVVNATLTDGGTFTDGNVLIGNGATINDTFNFTVLEDLGAITDISFTTGSRTFTDLTFTWSTGEVWNLTDSSGTFLGTSLFTSTLLLANSPLTLTVTGTVLDATGFVPPLPTSYDFTIFTTAVPVPAAFWLFGSALVAFIGFGRRSAA